MSMPNPQSPQNSNKPSKIPEEKKFESDQNGRSTHETKTDKTSNGTKNSGKESNLFLNIPSNIEQIVVYVLLIISLFIILFFSSLIGGLILGIVAGYYFASEIVYYLRHLTEIPKSVDQFRFLVLIAVLLGLFIALPGLFIGAVVIATFKQVITGTRL